MRTKTCCFTGHRNIPERDRKNLQKALEDTIKALVNSGYRYFGAGGALGFDTMAEQTILSLREHNPAIKLILVLPCVSQADRWPAADVAVYQDIIKRADKVVYTGRAYTSDCMFKRNRHLVDNSSACICYLTKETGGTAYTVKYAKQQGLQVINLAQK